MAVYDENTRILKQGSNNVGITYNLVVCISINLVLIDCSIFLFIVCTPSSSSEDTLFKKWIKFTTGMIKAAEDPSLLIAMVASSNGFTFKTLTILSLQVARIDYSALC